MYAYKYDEETGGIILLPETLSISKEPRPVYAKELNILGFNEHWNYEDQDDYPYMWAEANAYYYRGRLVAKTKGGNLYEKPELLFCDTKGEKLQDPEPNGTTLRPIDLQKMNIKNQEMLTVIEQITVKKIFEVFKKYEKKLDVFHVAFSGGKDSIVLLELVKRALPKKKFIVVFGDTSMEFPDTYDVIDKIETQCKEEGIDFIRAKSHLDAKESWRLFGSPSRILRWCCSVHKSAPQALAIRNYLGKPNYKGLAFVGVRAEESVARSDYDYEDNKKLKGQQSHNSILEWNSAEIWSYIFCEKLEINYAYKMGNQRAGCLLCPMSAKTDYIKNIVYTTEIQEFEQIIRENYSEENLKNGYWTARTNGAQLKVNDEKCKEKIEASKYFIEITDLKTDWKEWIKTLGKMPFEFFVESQTNKTIISFDDKNLRDYPTEAGLLKKVFHKAAFCSGCRVCETNCSKGCIDFNVKLSINNCINCQNCNQLDGGCLVYNSRKYPIKVGQRMSKSVDSFNTHAPKTEWIRDFFERRNDFLNENTLGPEQKVRFKRFLRSSGLTESDKFSMFADYIARLGWDSEIATGLIFANLAYNPQINWYIKHLELGVIYSRKSVVDMLINEGNSEITSKIVASAYKRIVELPLGTVLNFGAVTLKGKEIETITRTPCLTPDNRVFLYSLYKFAENANDYYEFTLSRLLNYDIDSDGLSPTLIFSIERETAKRILTGLSARYPDFITASFTHDLDKITLYPSKKSEDILTLF